MNYNYLFNKYNEINNLFINFLINIDYLNNLLTLKYLYNRTINFVTIFIIIYLFFYILWLLCKTEMTQFFLICLLILRTVCCH